MARIAGGIFGLPQSIEPRFQHRGEDRLFLREGNLYLANGRCAMFCLIGAIRPGRVWVPSFFCPTMLEPIRASGVRFEFYEIKEDLTAGEGWLSDLNPGELVICINYFGFPIDGALVDAVHARGGLVLEDASQALLSTHVGRCSDYVMYSPRKMVGTPDGGVLASVGGRPLPTLDLDTGLTGWQQTLIEAAIARREFDAHGGDRRWYELFRRAEHEREAPIGPIAMSSLSEALLRRTFDYAWIAARRRENFEMLNERLSRWGVFTQLAPGVVPLGYPIACPDRDAVREALFSHEVYPPVHWALGDAVPERFDQSHRLSERIMTLPCDQRCSGDRVMGMIDALEKALGA